MLSLDDYFMTDVQKAVTDPETGKTVVKTVSFILHFVFIIEKILLNVFVK